MVRIKIGNVKPVKGVDYMTPADIEELANIFAKKEDVPDLSALQEDVNNLTTSLADVEGMDARFAPAYTYGTEDLEAGTTALETGKLHFVYEE